MLIELSQVSRSFGAIRALDRVTANVDGKIIGLLGPNGAGKSTLLKCMLGLSPHDGEAKILGLSSSTEAFKIRDRVGYMPEIDAYLAGMTAVELCAYAGELSGLPPNEAMQRAHASLYFAGLEDKRYLKVEGYSTGMKQRVKLAQALVHDPALLFLDEPTNGLDPAARDDMLDLIAALPTKRGCAVVLSTHLLPDVDRICDHALILAKGTVKFNGTIEELRGAAMSEQRFTVEVRDGHQAFADVLKTKGFTIEPGSSRGIVVTVPEGGQANDVFRVAREHNAQIRHFEPHRETIEQAFLRVIGESNERSIQAN